MMAGRVFTRQDRLLASAIQGGGIGNRILQIWAGLAFAKATGREFVFFEQHITPNPHTPRDETRAFLFALFPGVRIFRGYVKWERMVEGSDLNRGAKHVALEGFFKSMVHGCGEKGGLVVPPPALKPDIAASIDFSHAYFVHFRFGDFVGGHFAVDLTGYYSIAVASVLAEDPLARFLLFSDEPSRIDVKGLGLDGATIVPLLGMWQTFWLMSQCYGGICANSTFSTCASWALKGPVYMPRLWKTCVAGAVVSLPEWANGL
jgi:predicted small lipoprotein YifL